MDQDWQNYTVPNPERYEIFPALPYAGNGHPRQTLYYARPKEKQNASTIFWLHGGGMTGDGREYLPGFYDGNNAVVEVRYRVTSDAPAPAQLEDAATALGWVWQHLAKYGGTPDKVLIGGMSAGAYLAAMITMAPEYGRRCGYATWRPAGIMLVSGQMTTHFQFKADLGYPGNQFTPVIDKLAPLAYLSAELPPILLITGEAGLDMPARMEENAFMAASLRALGHSRTEHYALPGIDHGTVLDNSEPLLQQFIRKVLAPS